jgi:hypothetical protein
MLRKKVQFNTTVRRKSSKGAITDVPLDDNVSTNPDYEKKPRRNEAMRILTSVMSRPESERQASAKLANTDFKDRPLLYYLLLKTYPNNRDVIQEYLHNTGSALDYLDIFVLFLDDDMRIASPYIINYVKKQPSVAKYFMDWYFKKHKKSLLDVIGSTVQKQNIVSLFIDSSDSEKAKAIALALDMLPRPEDEQPTGG